MNIFICTKSNLIIIAGRPAMGKTALATNIAYNVADFMSREKNIDKKDKGVAFFSLEMSSDELASRILSTVTQTPGQNMRTGEINNAEFTRIAAAVRELENMDLIPDELGGNRYLCNGNMIDIGSAGKTQDDTEQIQKKDDNEKEDDAENEE